MTDLREAAEELRRIESAVAKQFAAIPTPEAPDKPSERVENVAIAVGIAGLLAILFT